MLFMLNIDELILIYIILNYQINNWVLCIILYCVTRLYYFFIIIHVIFGLANAYDL